ncbi:MULTISPECIES: dTDP-4-dehydrorhamnose 3,5-epimerase [Acetobacter]|jgi:dTDP-4-dehydrorhamnose 3,5-epimerase|uniref:dTDP-4-dehydrorhamnose 3,5-epimerase n=1 Tax=Acetobacter lovaniensis TaxID=104100 RepID=A0A841QFP7_9PROT|nr:dTDP-4-dehydrorhamnose 3,5-epimerase [Acetobacter lovaniensis]MBB6457195.1 dTDP-4-dehydrorhamnose 3,5-epimerase [Acetobacter lovaniensis]MCI1697775.1 dTDP-4-dehydrorhamnose 3,5-epimerase [Acetobacter lovaniensis]MCI1795800.1 dTDP-4-dehydrorhamnose 3,5-epimerase [Acetobacter lovaniensis]MCP1239463.1 dTDP-4-dehydrorhamnose 3,5-epimerase [Acetobacter lovaniensis]NHN81226.1 dTDP-4-dehydrorhamnose 3,5-epimerase [Acetobacter lovaniensis]
MFDQIPTALSGVFMLLPVVRKDERGSFTKLYHADCFARMGMNRPIVEQYVTTSHKGVLRGLHFQKPPHDHDKLVTCLSGEVLDVVLDLRRQSPTYGHHCCLRLSGEQRMQVFVPSGCAHGFYTLSDQAELLYAVSSLYNPEYDDGILWHSAGIDWPDQFPLVSQRDQEFQAFADFDSEF